MMALNCIYCEKQLTDDEHSEHIIPNGLSGKLESKQICCSKCNTELGKAIDSPFIKLFHPLLKRKYHFYKSHSAKIWPGDNMDNDFSTLLNINNCNSQEYYHLKQGLSKIAIEYAAYKNIDPAILRENYTMTSLSDGLRKQISYSSKIIPFYPMNRFDQYLELDAPFHLRHVLILFSHQNYLVCYIELYSTFQYYVILCEHWDASNIYKPYAQKVKMFDSSYDYNFTKPKELIQILANHNLWPETETKLNEIIEGTRLQKVYQQKKDCEEDLWSILSDSDFFSKVLEKIDKKFYYTSLQLAYDITQQLCQSYNKNFLDIIKNNTSSKISPEFRAIAFYFDDDDNLNDGTFRRYSPQYIENYREICFYPTLCSDISPEEHRKYQEDKLKRLHNFLINTIDL